MGSRLGKVALQRATVDLVGSVTPLDSVDPDEDDFIGVYGLCYRQIFKERPDRYFESDTKKIGEVIRTAKDIGCPLRLYMMAVMLSHRDSTPGMRFYGSRLSGPSALKRVRLYRDVARETFGVFDPEAVAQLTGEKSDMLCDSLRASEELAAGFVIGHKIRFTSSAVNAFYSDRELGLHPAWLAVEPSYLEWCQYNKPETDEIKRHRSRVSQIDRRSWAEICRLRNSMVVPAGVRALRRYGINPEHVLVESPVTDSMTLWNSLGVLIRQVICLKYLAGDTEMLQSGVQIS